MPSPLFARKPLKLLLEELEDGHRLRRVLGPVQLTSLGVGAIIGTGIFVLSGQAAHDKAGPALMLSFVVAGLACVFAALCYAEFASMVPVAGSAYTYAYATLGELFAWIIGWDLILEYTVASAAVAHGWSKYFQNLIGMAHIGGVHVELPTALKTAPFDYIPETGRFVTTGSWIDITAVAIVAAVTVVLVRGIRESATFNTVMVMVKLAVVLFVLAVGAFFVNPANWVPFAPFGFTGVRLFGIPILGSTDAGGQPVGMLAGAAIIFFAYIGFDSISTHAEEARRPQRDVPIGLISSLLICTILYIAIAAVLTGMVPYDKIDIEAPVADAFRQVGMPWAQFLVAIGALTGITSVLLVMMLSQPRIWLAMARDGLVSPGFFGAVHDRFRTPWKSTILAGVVVAAAGGLLPLRALAELTNIGTLFAFVIVCAAVLIMRKLHPNEPRPFRTPWVPFVPIAGMSICLLLMLSLPPENWTRLFVWLGVGLGIYFLYGRKRSVLARLRQQTGTSE
jgi:basic amino acid/polyamine antiporter, APA family